VTPTGREMDRNMTGGVSCVPHGVPQERLHGGLHKALSSLFRPRVRGQAEARSALDLFVLDEGPKSLAGAARPASAELNKRRLR
jgi:hypothetical protein